MKKNLLTSIIILLSLFHCNAKEDKFVQPLLTTTIGKGPDGSVMTTYFREGKKIMMAAVEPKWGKNSYTFYRDTTELGSVLVSKEGVLKAVFLDGKNTQNLAVYWMDRDKDGFDDLMLISVKGGLPLEAFYFSKENILSPVPDEEIGKFVKR